jgi:carbon-monoxide dehydrogenase small subunit
LFNDRHLWSFDSKNRSSVNPLVDRRPVHGVATLHARRLYAYDDIRMNVTVIVNGVRHEQDVEPRLLLSDYLRQNLGLTGTHVGCEHGVCGACTILFDGEPARSCIMLAVQANGHAVQTVEGLAPAEGGLHPIQAAFKEAHALQCGFCTPGILMTLSAYLRDNPKPTEPEIREALSANLCRCTGYQHIVNAVTNVSRQQLP